MPAGALGALLLLTASPLAVPASSGAPAAATAEVRFAPPVGVPLRYRVTTRRIGRDGKLIDFALVYALQWQRTGRGYRLDSVLERIDSGGEPGVTRMLMMMLDPLVGEEISYLVPPDGSRIDMVDPDQLWERVTARMEKAGAEADRPEARQLAQLIAALPAAERDRLAAADIRALIAPANDALPAIATPDDGDVSIVDDGARRTIAMVERDSASVAGKAQPLEIANLWTIDTDTGLVVRERRQSWIVTADGEGRRLIEERVRALEPAP
ncbi:hypothetical protein GGR90_002684 [Sphingopyxis italica]|uniref:DUF3108 domain-containing protein n=1 Tax=Sphingopyxis italica TaxID=1129133 RepID=A0A7X5XSG8_9SPHN|nr:hypothetical protein [Sphingopyxis italica]NJB90490.1 hypothetical protein [Sphingopyxis italica]